MLHPHKLCLPDWDSNPGLPAYMTGALPLSYRINTALSHLGSNQEQVVNSHPICQLIYRRMDYRGGGWIRTNDYWLMRPVRTTELLYPASTAREIRTRNPRIKSALLCPFELRRHVCFVRQSLSSQCGATDTIAGTY